MENNRRARIKKQRAINHNDTELFESIVAMCINRIALQMDHYTMTVKPRLEALKHQPWLLKPLPLVTLIPGIINSRAAPEALDAPSINDHPYFV
ncbi:hypothetical protein WN48_09270 [Eufriesea mexicana]|uniref:Uncharacterized protein n=1 Tax=Eufriesea mexicana TaxID=516756 RepID=A0A310SEF4_9HYME|nr:hypothetical protein WN48_09270 [Eufriesea mexicana]